MRRGEGAHEGKRNDDVRVDRWPAPSAGSTRLGSARFGDEKEEKKVHGEINGRVTGTGREGGKNAFRLGASISRTAGENRCPGGICINEAKPRVNVARNDPAAAAPPIVHARAGFIVIHRDPGPTSCGN